MRGGIKRKRAYTLLELLISVAIFSGLVILVIATFARSAGSSAKVNQLREKTEAGRTVIDAISNDFRYLYKNRDYRIPGYTASCGTTCNLTGYDVLVDRLAMLLLYPGKNPDNELVLKIYTIKNDLSGRLTLYVKESRSCSINPSAVLQCPNLATSTEQDLLGTRFGLDSADSKFGGITVLTANSRTPKITPYVTMSFLLKPADSGTTPCLSLPTGTCYKVATTLNVGSKL